MRCGEVWHKSMHQIKNMGPDAAQRSAPGGRPGGPGATQTVPARTLLPDIQTQGGDCP